MGGGGGGGAVLGRPPAPPPERPNPPRRFDAGTRRARKQSLDGGETVRDGDAPRETFCRYTLPAESGEVGGDRGTHRRRRKARAARAEFPRQRCLGRLRDHGVQVDALKLARQVVACPRSCESEPTVGAYPAAAREL